jgi:hypothetical protein
MNKICRELVENAAEAERVKRSVPPIKHPNRAERPDRPAIGSATVVGRDAWNRKVRDPVYGGH